MLNLIPKFTQGILLVKCCDIDGGILLNALFLVFLGMTDFFLVEN